MKGSAKHALPQMGFRLWLLSPCTGLYPELPSFSIHYPVMNDKRPNLAFLSPRNFCLAHMFEKMGTLGSFPGHSGFQNMVFL